MIEDDYMQSLHHDFLAEDAWRLVDAKSKASRKARAGSDLNDQQVASEYDAQWTAVEMYTYTYYK